MNGQRMRPEERYACAVLQSVLSADVEWNDDGSSEAMFDLRVRHRDGSTRAVEVTSSVDGQALSLWKLMNGHGRWIEPAIAGGWMVTLRPTARAKVVRRLLPSMLAELEHRGIRSWDRDELSRERPTVTTADAIELLRADQSSSTSFPGSIYVTLELDPERSGGMVPSTGDPLSYWVTDFLASAGRTDVVAKLRRAAEAAKEVFIVVAGLADAPFEVVDLLMREDAPAPSMPPEMPDGLTGVWIVSTWSSGRAFSWSEQAGWASHDKPLPRAQGNAGTRDDA